MPENKKNCRLGTVGGQAVIEGVMMKSRERYSVAVRMPDDSIKITNKPFVSARKKIKILNIPLIRGIANFVEMMLLSYKTLSISTEAFGLEEDEESKFEKWLKEKFGKSVFDFVMVISMILGVALGFGLFFYLPIFITKTIDSATGNNISWGKSIIEGIIKIAIFVIYIWIVSFMKDIRRTFEYHGAEHKSIFCYESGEALTVENVKKHTRFHPRCGTSFIFVILIISIISSSLITWENSILRMIIKVLLLPVVVGLGYEFIMYAGKHDNPFIKIVSWPGLLMQRLTTQEPDEKQIEVAITALKNALPEEFPEAVNASDPASANLAEDTSATDLGSKGNINMEEMGENIPDTGDPEPKTDE